MSRAETDRKRLYEALERKKNLEELAALLENETMRDFLWRIISACNLYTEPFDANAAKMSYNLGRHSIARMLLVEINEANPSAWVQMQVKSYQAAQARLREELDERARQMEERLRDGGEEA